MTRGAFSVGGYTLVELLVALALSGVVIAGLAGVMERALQSATVAASNNALIEDVRFAMERMVRTVGNSRHMLLPLADNPATNWPEHLREQTVPASPPIGDSTLATAVLAVTLPGDIDLNGDGVPDADNDGDGRIDEDLANDIVLDFLPGIGGIDDDGDGSVDEDPFLWWDDDERGVPNEDPLDGLDNDADGNVDEDPASDNNGDGCPGLCGVDDDADGFVDEGSADDDDEDGGEWDDAYDPVVFYLDNGALMERMPVPWNEDGVTGPVGPVDGNDFVVGPIAENVTRFRVERLPRVDGQPTVVDLTLEVTDPVTAETVSLTTRVRVGGAL